MNSRADQNSWFAAPQSEICICGLGARTPVGLSAAPSAAAVRAAVSAIRLHPTFVDKEGEPVSFGSDFECGPDLGLAERLRTMLTASISEAMGPAAGIEHKLNVSYCIGLAEPRPGFPADVVTKTSNALAQELGIADTALKMLPRGHAAGLLALQWSAEQLTTGQADLCIAAGVDSYHDPRTIRWLDQKGYLMSAENRNGFPPGEAAGACLLAKRSLADHYGLEVRASLLAASTAFEPKSIRKTEVCVGEALTAVIKKCSLSPELNGKKISTTYCDLNGERYRSEELLYTLLRVQGSFSDPHDYLTPADCWGDIGAASGLGFVALAVASLERGYARGVHPILWSGSESGWRTAALLRLGSDQGGVG